MWPSSRQCGRLWSNGRPAAGRPRRRWTTYAGGRCAGEELGLTEEELAFYDALETNDSAVAVMGDEVLSTIARELVETVRSNKAADTVIEQAEALTSVWLA